MVGDVRFRPEDHQLIRPVVIVRGKAPKDMKNEEDFWKCSRLCQASSSCKSPAPSAATSPVFLMALDLPRNSVRGRLGLQDKTQAQPDANVILRPLDI